MSSSATPTPTPPPATPTPAPIDYEPKRPRARRSWLRDDVAYVLPFAGFMACLWVGTTWRPLFVPSYVVREIVTIALLILCWPHYTRIRWNGWWLGLIVGVIGIFQWVPMQLWLQNHIAYFKPSPDVFDPEKFFHTPASFWSCSYPSLL